MLVRPSPLRHVLAHGFLHPGSSPSSPILVGRSFASSSLRLTEVEVYHAPQSTSSHAFTQLQRTPLYVFHLSNRAKMVPFAGWSMPLSYGDTGQSASPCHSSPTLLRPGPKLTPPVVAHNHVRTSAGLFDVSHMLQHRFAGPSAQGFLMSLCPSSLNALAPFSSTLSVLLNEEGGIIDDTIITKQESDESFYVVTNAGRASEDKAFIGKKLEEWSARVEGEVKWETLDRWGLLALQGPKAGEALQSLTSGNLAGIRFGQSGFVEIGKEGVRCHVARGGYTGEDGFEISIPPEHTVALTEEIANHPDVMLIGLGARDSLRLEAGMCLYGHDLNETVSPVEAGLSWLIGKDRRSADSPNPFPGQSRILEELSKGPKRRRVGLEITESPAREGCKIFDSTGSLEIGVVTSGIPSPALGTNIAMGYVANGSHKKGTSVMIQVRRKMREAVVRPMPFVPTRYFK